VTRLADEHRRRVKILSRSCIATVILTQRSERQAIENAFLSVNRVDLRENHLPARG
jgi:hypothetical protein